MIKTTYVIIEGCPKVRNKINLGSTNDLQKKARTRQLSFFICPHFDVPNSYVI